MFVTPQIDQLKASELLSKRKRIWSSGRKIIKVELTWLPIYLFQVTLIDKKGNIKSDKISVDGIKGEFAFYSEAEFSKMKEPSGLIPDFLIAEEDAREIAMSEYKRLLFKNNLKTGSDAKITFVSMGSKFHYPYWTGFFKNKEILDFEVIDALDGSTQGHKMRPVFINILLNT